MANNNLPGRRFAGAFARGAAVVLLLALTACAADPQAGAPVAEDAAPPSPLAYYQMLQRMTPVQNAMAPTHKALRQ